MHLIKFQEIGRRVALRTALIIVMVFSVAGVWADETVQTFEFANINSCSITAVTGSVDVKTHNLDKVIVIFENNMVKPELLTIDVTQVDGHLAIVETIHENEAKGKTALRIYLPGSIPYKFIECISALGHITFHGFETDSLTAHASSKPIHLSSVSAGELRITTASTPITMIDCKISKYGKLVTSDGMIDIDLPSLPSTELHAASTFGEVNLRVPTFGESFQLILSRNENRGKFIMPFECMESGTKRLHENDTYRTNRCIINRGSDGPVVDLLTGSGTIRILSENTYESKKESSAGH
ncbi:MAG: DUF4097 domain-containing protein [FCB group bacterium]|nr:DUF4097 domain-containing protein [FCB group bacterium]